jgi:hypothetical protein
VQLPIESQYIATIADNLNAEIVLGTVQVRETAVALQVSAGWLLYRKIRCSADNLNAEIVLGTVQVGSPAVVMQCSTGWRVFRNTSCIQTKPTQRLCQAPHVGALPVPELRVVGCKRCGSQLRGL